MISFFLSSDTFAASVANMAHIGGMAPPASKQRISPAQDEGAADWVGGVFALGSRC
jgi:hypothetical protein